MSLESFPKKINFTELSNGLERFGISKHVSESTASPTINGIAPENTALPSSSLRNTVITPSGAVRVPIAQRFKVDLHPIIQKHRREKEDKKLELTALASTGSVDNGSGA